MEKLLIVSHEVNNYPEWREVFDEHESVRSQYGIRLKGLYHASNNPNMITMIFEIPSTEKANDFMEHSDVKKVMKKAGVISEPDIRILEAV